MISGKGLLALLLVVGLVVAFSTSTALSLVTPDSGALGAKHPGKDGQGRGWGKGDHGKDDDHGHRDEHGKGSAKIEARGNVTSSGISGIEPGDKVKVEAKLREGKKLVLVVPGKGRVVANVTGVSIDAAGGKVRVNATVVSSTIGGISKDEGLSLSFTLTQFTIEAPGGTATISIFKIEFVNRP